MPNQILNQINDTIKPAIKKAYDLSIKKDPFQKQKNISINNFGFLLQKEIESKQYELSRLLYKLDSHLNKKKDNRRVYNRRQNSRTASPPDFKKYVKEAYGGYQINKGDGTAIQVSKNAKIKITQKTITYEGALQTVLEVMVNDPSTNTYLHFIDDNRMKKGFEKTFIGTSSSYVSGLPNSSINWEDPFYNMVKKNIAIGIGSSSIIAGALEANELANFTPWRNMNNARGWYSKSNGIKISLGKLKNGRGAAGHRIGAEWATKRASKFKVAGKICFGISIVFSGVDVMNASINNDYNRNEVYVKSTVDIFMGAVGVWGGPIGWGISGTYFILDAFGVFGDWGKASGVDVNGVPYGSNVFDTDFEMNLVRSTREEGIQQQLQRLQREREIRIDNTYVTPPKILFKKNLK